MRHGLSLAPFGQLADPRVVAALAADAERAGFDGVFLWDHMYRADPFRPVADPWIALAAVAAATDRIRLGPLVTPVARRRPQKLARETTTLDHLSGGRLIVGVGLGVNTGGELTRFAEEDDDRIRGDRLDEGLDLLSRLWSGEEVSHHGPHFTADAVRFLPRPVQEPRIPIWVAAPTGRGRPSAGPRDTTVSAPTRRRPRGPPCSTASAASAGASTGSTSSWQAFRAPTRAAGSGPGRPGGSSTSPTRSIPRPSPR